MRPIPVAGIDPGFVRGGDGCYVVFGLHGDNREGKRILLAKEHMIITEDRTNIKEDRHFQIARKVKEECLKRGVSPENVGYDCTGGGEPWGGILAEVWSPECLGVMFGGGASDMIVGVLEKKPANELYADRVSELWAVGRDFLRSGQLFGLSGVIAQQMASRRYSEIKRGDFRLIEVESKKSMRKRMSGKSPNEADCFFIMLDLCRQRHKFRADVARIINIAQRRKWEHFVAKQDEVSASGPRLTNANDVNRQKVPWHKRLQPIKVEGWGGRQLIR